MRLQNFLINFSIDFRAGTSRTQETFWKQLALCTCSRKTLQHFNLGPSKHTKLLENLELSPKAHNSTSRTHLTHHFKRFTLLLREIKAHAQQLRQTPVRSVGQVTYQGVRARQKRKWRQGNELDNWSATWHFGAAWQQQQLFLSLPRRLLYTPRFTNTCAARWNWSD